VKEIEQIIDLLQTDNPHVTILVARLIPAMKREADVEEMNAAIEQLVTRKNRKESPIVLVDLNSGFDPYNDLFDRVHPNIYGSRKMASKWFDAIQDVLEERQITKLGT
jgi:lysophospholipase L1-like esterase